MTQRASPGRWPGPARGAPRDDERPQLEPSGRRAAPPPLRPAEAAERTPGRSGVMAAAEPLRKAGGFSSGDLCSPRGASAPPPSLPSVCGPAFADGSDLAVTAPALGFGEAAQARPEPTMAPNQWRWGGLLSFSGVTIKHCDDSASCPRRNSSLAVIGEGPGPNGRPRPPLLPRQAPPTLLRYISDSINVGLVCCQGDARAPAQRFRRSSKSVP